MAAEAMTATMKTLNLLKAEVSEREVRSIMWTYSRIVDALKLQFLPIGLGHGALNDLALTLRQSAARNSTLELSP